MALGESVALLYPKEADFHLRQGMSLLRPADSNLTGFSTTSTGREACLLRGKNIEGQTLFECDTTALREAWGSAEKSASEKLVLDSQGFIHHRN